ncbi:BRcat and Rcat domain-containing protein [Aspergillus mulundensis]|uniref:RBR-type E3 ubiquitin transferase n=1 Tax=Aspergillus mulundensis TaxID=1810919 RepID=A0A3D8S5Z2_9EURO|nr:hypothetical protein DSM5745_05269 [Aspergillus mulundensis]RDW81712.1 hypothetical protein DSM5745_05269 [Aspergillus mulundensis]
MASVLASDLDQETADLILKLQLEDASCHLHISESDCGDLNDEDLAFQLQNEELQCVSQLLWDRKMAKSFAVAVEADAQILAEHLAEESGETTAAPKDEGPDMDSPDLDDETLRKLKVLYISGIEDDAESMAANGHTDDNETSECIHPVKRSCLPLRRCIACREEVEFINAARAPCQHDYCRPCLLSLFKASLTDETLFPPRCCRQRMDTSAARIFLSSDFLQRYNKKKLEFSVVNRTYCYSPACSSFIHPNHIVDDVATCPECRLTTCASCKGRAHTGDCPNDNALQQLLTLAQENGWQRCYSCWRVVELNYGCNHMTCRCGAEFCYNCGERWKICECADWNEHHLLQRAYQIIDRDREANNLPTAAAGIAPAAAPPPNAAEPQDNRAAVAVPREEAPDAPEVEVDNDLLARVMEDLRENHECSHDGAWRYISGSHRCEVCSHRLPHYIFECRECSLWACWRCRRNRL